MRPISTMFGCWIWCYEWERTRRRSIRPGHAKEAGLISHLLCFGVYTVTLMSEESTILLIFWKTIHFIYWKLRKEKNTSDCLVLANNQWQNGIIWAQKKIIIIIAQPVVLYCVWYSKFHLWYNKLKLMVHNFFFPLIIDMVCLFLGKYIYFTFLQGVSTVSSLFKQSKTYII